jgi:LemA protein
LAWVIVVIAAAVLLGLAFVLLYNRLVRLRNRSENAWAQVEVQLKRRHDLIPNLVETVKGYAGHERATLDSVTEARTSAQQAKTVEQQAAAESGLTAALGRLFAVAEAYPQLRATENFQQLQSELEETEDKIAVARQLYNDAVLAYDNARETVPTSLVAGMLSFEPKPYFEIDDRSRAVPEAEFSALPAPQDG